MDWLTHNPRRLGTGLLVFGLSGVILAGIVAVGLVLGAFAARDLDERIEADRVRLVATLERTSQSVATAAEAARNAGTTLDATRTTLEDAQVVLDDLATASGDLGDALDLQILGSQPFAGVAARFTELAGRLEQFADNAGALAVALGANVEDVGTIADELDVLRGAVDDLAARLEAFDRTGDLVGLLVGGILLGGLVVAWVAVAAALCAWVGWRLRASAAPPGAQPASRPEGPTPSD